MLSIVNRKSYGVIVFMLVFLLFVGVVLLPLCIMTGKSGICFTVDVMIKKLKYLSGL